MKGTTILVLGASDIGSAIAHRLHALGAAVVLCDLPRSAHSRRGMAFTDALFDGVATLDGVVARRVDSVGAIRAAWSTGDAIPLTTIPELDLAREFHFDVAVDATMRRQVPREDRRALATRVVGLGPGFEPGVNCHVAVETQWGRRLGAAVFDAATAPRDGQAPLLDGVGRERFVVAPASGRWHTRAAIGFPVEAGDVIGDVDGVPVVAPRRGSLRGLTRDDVDVVHGHRVVEIDPRNPPRVFGLGERPAAIANGVCHALGLPA